MLPVKMLRNSCDAFLAGVSRACLDDRCQSRKCERKPFRRGHRIDVALGLIVLETGFGAGDILLL